MYFKEWSTHLLFVVTKSAQRHIFLLFALNWNRFLDRRTPAYTWSQTQFVFQLVDRLSLSFSSGGDNNKNCNFQSNANKSPIAFAATYWHQNVFNSRFYWGNRKLPNGFELIKHIHTGRSLPFAIAFGFRNVQATNTTDQLKWYSKSIDISYLKCYSVNLAINVRF